MPSQSGDGNVLNPTQEKNEFHSFKCHLKNNQNDKKRSLYVIHAFTNTMDNYSKSDHVGTLKFLATGNISNSHCLISELKTRVKRMKPKIFVLFAFLSISDTNIDQNSGLSQNHKILQATLIIQSKGTQILSL